MSFVKDGLAMARFIGLLLNRLMVVSEVYGGVRVELPRQPMRRGSKYQPLSWISCN